jgi:tRNA A37 N6-isopentenylltransferase MiaA
VCKLNHYLDEKFKKLEETIQRVATNTIGYTRKQANKEWFDKRVCSDTWMNLFSVYFSIFV